MIETINTVFDLISLLVNNYQILLILPIFMALKAEKHYVARTSILANTVSMFVAVAPYWDATRSWGNVYGISLFHIYVLIGLFFGIWAFLSYMLGNPLDEDFYVVTWIFYNTAFATLVCIFAILLL